MLDKLPAYMYAAALVVVVVVLGNLTSGVVFPIPWVDESFFLLQSLAFAHDNTLLAPELIPDRHVMWMQPGYMILQGLLFKVVDFSLHSARELSLVFYCAAIWLFCKALCCGRANVRFLISALVFLVPSSFVASNVARMESVVLACALGALVATQAHRFALAVALVLLASLVHPNGVYFLLPITLALICARRELVDQFKRTRATDWGLLALALVLVLAYGLYVALQIDAFRIDMAFQFARKLERRPFYYDLKSVVLLSIALAVMLVFLWRGKSAEAVTAAFASMMILIAVNGQEMWYLVFRNVGIGALVLLILAEVQRPLLRWLSTGVLALAYVAVAGFTFAGMRPTIGSDYVGQKVADALKVHLLQTKERLGGTLTVSFNVSGADLLFYDFLRSNGIALVRRMPQEMTSARTVDLCIYIARKEDPPWLRENWAADFPAVALCRQGIAMSRSRDELSILTPVEYARLLEERRARKIGNAG